MWANGWEDIGKALFKEIRLIWLRVMAKPI